jgi:diguanylate cyclase
MMSVGRVSFTAAATPMAGSAALEGFWTMYSEHGLREATEYADQARTLMEQRQIAPHPNNFALWYRYAADQPDVRIALDALIRKGEVIDEERSRMLFEAFCSDDRAQASLCGMAESLEREIGTVLESLACAGRNAKDYTQLLEHALGEAEQAQVEDRLFRVFARLLSRTRMMSEHSREVERQLETALAETSRLKQELAGARRQALTDSLTGLANRSRFDEALHSAVLAAAETSMPLSLLLIDIDHFKNFNDDYGHVIGDQVLRLLGTVLTDNIKGFDLAARFGGEEFAVILPDTASCDGRRVADNIRRKVAEKKLFNRQTGQKLATVTVSIGVAEFAADEPVSGLIERADRALYFAKRTGRNRVIADEDVHGAKVANC